MEFVPTRGWQKFCHTKCRNEYWRKLRKEVMEEIINRNQGGKNE